MNDDELLNNLIQKKLSNNFGLFDFDGQNCNDYAESESLCNGWDGRSQRCECGNRRVSWCLSDDKTYIFGEAW